MSVWSNLLLGAGAGFVTAAVAWKLADRKLEARFDAGAKQLQSATREGRATLEARLARGRRELDTRVRQIVESEVPPRVQIALATSLARYGITPETGRNVAVALAAARRTGLLGVQVI